jgi:hypothetical protein
MAEHTKQDRELQQFRRFQCAFRGAPLGDIQQPNPPEPDIVVVGADGSRHGIELTDLNPGGDSGQVHREADSLRNQVLLRARALWVQTGRPPLHVWVSWKPDGLPRDRHRLAARLCDFVSRHLPQSDPAVDFEVAPEDDWPILRVSVSWASELSGGDWRDGDMHEVPPLTEDEIQRRIERKSERTKEYRETYACLWLLLIHSDTNPSTWAHVTTTVRNATYASRFDRVGLFDLVRGQCQELLLNREPLSRP